MSGSGPGGDGRSAPLASRDGRVSKGDSSGGGGGGGQYPFPSTTGGSTTTDVKPSKPGGSRPKFSQRALSLFSRNKSSTSNNTSGESSSRTLSYQPRIKPSATPPSNTIQDRLQSVMPSSSSSSQQQQQQKVLVMDTHIPGSLPIVPSYHEKAHPEISAPSQVFNLLDGPSSKPAPVDPVGGTLPGPRYQKPAIKVKIITWNMGGTSLPKGDLEVLLGRVGGYIPPDQNWDIDEQSENGDQEQGDVTPQGGRPPSIQIYREDQSGSEGDTPSLSAPKLRGKGAAGQEHIPRQDRIPPLPHDDAHPFHLVIVSSQECPWGDGKRIATGLGMAGEISDLARSKSRATHPKSTNTSTGDSISVSLNSSKSSSVPTPSMEIPQTPTTYDEDKDYLDVETKSKGKRGWSDMCEDWLCRGPSAQNYATKGLAATTEAVLRGTVQKQSKNHQQVSGSEPPSPRQGPTTDVPGQQGMSRSTTSNTLSIPIPSFVRSNSSTSISSSNNTHKSKSSANSTPNASGAASPIAGAVGSPLGSPSTPIASKDFAFELGGSPEPANSTATNTASNITKAKAKQQLHLQIPGPSQRDGTPHSLGAYELIAKERCAMIYMAVYCWRGCRDRVRGVSRSHVKSGMLAGRVGNKGAVGISVKLGQSRLLFVNSHLAAHEGRLQTRLDNIAKIKRELRVDTYLPADDPRNASEDVTEMFDHSFWFGDLNFRVDITRQHADWLMKTKKYDQALEFDQLRKILKGQDGDSSFKGFRESEITFPPTYKYDVLKTLKNASGKKRKQRTIKRILHRRGHSALGVITDTNGNGLLVDADDEGDDEDDEDSDDDVSKMMILSSPLNSVDTPLQEVRISEEGPDEEDSSSISSSAWDSFGSGSIGHRNRLSHNNSSSHRRSRSEGAMLYSSESDSESASDSDIRLHTNKSSEEDEDDDDDDDQDPIVTSNTTAASRTNNVLYPFSHGNAIKAKFKLIDLMKSATGSTPHTKEKEKDRHHHHHHHRKHSPVSPSSSSSGHEGNTAAPLSASGSSGSLHGSYTSSTSAQQALNRSLSNSSTATAKTIDTLASEEGEQQRYDTSAKQRVPSWTDRVLWRSNVVQPSEEEQTSHSRTARIVLKGKAVTEAVRHVHSRNLVKMDTPVMTRSKTFSHASQNDTQDSPNAVAQGHGHGHGRLSRFLHHHHHHHAGESTDSSRSSTSDRDRDGVQSIATRRPNLSRRASAGGGLTRSPSSSDHLSPTLNALRIVSQPIPRDDGVNRHHVQGESSQHSTSQDDTPVPNTQSSRLFSSWWSTHAPTILTAQGAVAALNSLTNTSSTTPNTTTASPAESVVETVELIGPSKGQVECLLYKSLDDKEMRSLEGRSDHRPVIWVGAVGI